MTGASESLLHVDMDAFYASVEQRDDPSLRGRPVAVGGAGRRGVVAAASYEARRHGVRSALPMMRARHLCPELVVLPTRMAHYTGISRRVMAILRDVSPLVEPISLDEAFVDVSGATRLFGTPVEIGHAIRRRVREELDLPCSVGVASTKSVAKLLSARAKPDGILHWPTDRTAERLRDVEVSALWGVGPTTHGRLAEHGVRTIGDLLDLDALLVRRVVGDATAVRLLSLARGEDPRPVETSRPVRSVSHETTYVQDVGTLEELDAEVLRLAVQVARRLRASGRSGRTVTVKVRSPSFETHTRATTLERPTDLTHEIGQVARELLDQFGLDTPVRLLGVAVSNLVEGSTGQLSLDGGEGERWRAVDAVSDAVGRRFGDRPLPASLLGRQGRERSEDG
ncbi:MAG: DNA polymerase IV [Nitriliruptoraceae bacterium]